MTNDTTGAPITLTDSALSELRGVLAQDGNEGRMLRVFVSSAGCSGISYGMGLDTTVRDDDEIFEQGGVKVAVDPDSLAYLRGSEIDFVNEPSRSGFAIYNPNPIDGCSGGCSCGEDGEGCC